MSTTNPYAPTADLVEKFTPEETAQVTHYREQVAGIPDTFAGIEDPEWDIADGVRDGLTSSEIFAMYADLRAWAEHWIGFAHSLRFEARMSDSTEAFRLWTETELDSASNALRGLAGHALDEITGRRED